MRLKKGFPHDLMHKQFYIQAFLAYVPCCTFVFYPTHLEVKELLNNYSLLQKIAWWLHCLCPSTATGFLRGKGVAMKCRANVQQPYESWKLQMCDVAVPWNQATVGGRSVVTEKNWEKWQKLLSEIKMLSFCYSANGPCPLETQANPNSTTLWYLWPFTKKVESPKCLQLK